MSAACFIDLLASLVFAESVVLLGPSERQRGRIDGSFVLLLTAEHTAQPSRGLGFKVRPLRTRKGHCKFTEVKGWHINAAPERGEADLRISRKR